MPLKSLTDVIQEALDRPQFLDELLSNASLALDRLGWELTSEDRRRLDEIVQYRLDLVYTTKTLMEVIKRSDVPWPPPPWAPIYPWPPKPEWPPKH